jgi:hypothetical protein
MAAKQKKARKRNGRAYDPDVRHEAALKAWETRRASGWVHPSEASKPKPKRKAAAKVKPAKATPAKRSKARKPAKVVNREPEQVLAADVRIGDYIGTSKSGPFPKVLNLRDTAKQVTLTLAGEKTIRASFGKKFWRVP